MISGTIGGQSIRYGGSASFKEYFKSISLIKIMNNRNVFTANAHYLFSFEEFITRMHILLSQNMKETLQYFIKDMFAGLKVDSSNIILDSNHH